MQQRRAFSSVEILESRIAPAQFFVQSSVGMPGSLTVQTAQGTNAMDTPAETNAQMAAGATAAVLLHAGDRLIFDANNNHKFDPGDSVLLNVTKGSAMVFLTDGPGATTGGFDKNEITGLAVSSGFSGSLTNDIHGSVVTALDAAGNFLASGGTLTLEHASIAGLSTTGQIAGGSILAGGAISNIAVKNTNAVISIQGGIYTGTATNGLTGISFNNGGTTFTASYTAPAGVLGGGDISNVYLADGVQGIQSGNGADVAKGTAGNGGTIANLTVVNSPSSFSIIAGNGGAGATANTLGSGGSLVNIHVTEHAATGDAIQITAGNSGLRASGPGTPSGSGGTGGAVDGLKLDLLDPASSLSIVGGNGGAAGGIGIGNGGRGGAISFASIVTNTLGQFHLTGGTGGLGAPSGGTGGAGGSVIDAHVFLPGANTAGMLAGAGGSGFAGGNGGSIVGAVVRNSTVSGTPSIASWTITAGGGGTAFGVDAAAGAGGLVSDCAFTTGATVTTITGGLGGGAVSNHAGLGGALLNVAYLNVGLTGASVSMIAGSGGLLSLGNGNADHAGSGGRVSGVTLTNQTNGVLTGFQISSGSGGSVTGGTATAGTSGFVSKVNIQNLGDITGAADIRSGTGGTIVSSLAGYGDSGSGNGGSSGSVNNIHIHDTFGATNPFEVYAGVSLQTFSGSNKSATSMAGVGTGEKGGNVGAVDGVSLAGVLKTHVIIGQSDQSTGSPGLSGSITALQAAGAGGDGVQGVGGAAGNIMNVHGVVGTLDIEAPNGGAAASGTGGLGSSVKAINIEGFAHLIAAGNGGNGYLAGSGGSIRHVKVKGATSLGADSGDIGSFSQTFGISTSSSVMGGLIAGEEGASSSGLAHAINGNVAAVSADKIATILAGRPAANGITTLNAVHTITSIEAQVIGADTGITGSGNEPGGPGGTSTFTWNEGGTNTTFDVATPDGDTAIDGFVLGRTGFVTLPVRALKLIEV